MKERKPIKNIKGEIWKQYEDTPYFFSNCGRVKRKWKNHERLLSQCVINKKKGKSAEKEVIVKVHKKNVKVSRVVYKMFVGDIPQGYYIIHKDRVITNNDFMNLEALSPKEAGKKISVRNPKRRKIIDLDTGKIYNGTREAGKNLFVSYNCISEICNGKVKKPLVNVRWVDE